MESHSYNPTLCFKPQGDNQPEDMDNVAHDDFLLVIQTEFQRDMLLKYGDLCICMDATHGTNAYDFNLITVMVIDGLGEGIPVAWAIANREDTTILVEFLKAIKERIGCLQPCCFMSDDANQYFNAWKGVFGGERTTKLLCAWHVDRAWKTALNQHVHTKQSRNEIYHQLRMLLMENEEATFRQLLQQFISFLDASEKAFSKYFKEHYCHRLSEWASYCRIGSVVNTNMFLESFHRTLKIVYLQHKHNRSIDFLLHVLFKIARDKVFEQLTKLEKGKYTHKISEINKRHKEALKFEPLDECIRTIDGTTWTVLSARDGSIRYTVKLMKDMCTCDLRCSTCRACIHKYTCSCIDSTLHATVCKHAHAIAMMTANSTSDVSTSASQVNYFTNILEDGQQKCTHKEALRQQVLNKISEITVLVTRCKTLDTLKTASGHLTSAIVAINSLKETSPLPTSRITRKRNIPPNKNSEKQSGFFSTKKRHNCNTDTLSKPTNAQAQDIRSNLLCQETTCCGICLKEDDNSSTDLVNWLQCSSCDLWVHEKCVSPTKHKVTFKCPFC